ncbi:phosphoenolpyruvate-protein phosphotransferase [Clostridium sp. CAG:411]|jgi:phosphotransferase system enzyme I (PtsI)|nr:phosphoenolpyruvate--protein phosphotransferase [Lachnospiraceae bacterium]CDE44378.1 phosphoenolpyruvate-protein phosphotransferase [Clostridium sp. CAG:411]
MIQGIGASKGYGVGTIVRIEETDLSFEDKKITDVDAEVARFQKAVEDFTEKTMDMAAKMREQVGEKEAEILEGHVIMVSDPAMADEVTNQIKDGSCAERALWNVCDMFIQIFSMAEDELTNQRVTDVQDMRNRLLKILLGKEEVDISQVPKGTILAARDLTPSMTVGLHKENVVGILTEVGGKTSHSAILARALEIPAVLSIPDIMQTVKDGQEAALDGDLGVVILDPSEEEKAEYHAKREQYLKEKEALRALVGKPTITADGKQVELVCNIGKPQDSDMVLERDGEGVGLFRTEFLFMDRTNTPSEEEQFQAYKQVAETMQGKPVIIRTLDVGGDKEIPYLNLEKEDNPFLGYRAIRVCLKQKDLYRAQLRALLRASAYGDIRIMVPMVTCLDELRQVKEILGELMKELDQEQISYNKEIKVGIMVETPAASLMADLLAKEADFFSIGTNDLTQYTMVVDRGNAQVAYLYSAYNPAVLRSIAHVIACGNKAGIPVGMCGEAAADEKLIPLLLAYGLDEFSVSATSVLATRNTIAKWTIEEAKALAKEVEGLGTREEVEQLLEQRKK